MASNIARIAVRTCSQSRKFLLNPTRLCASKSGQPVRFLTANENGGILPKPAKVSFGPIKVVVTIVPFLLTGGFLSREFAAWLEETELFVPDDDDDD